jgi:hypothetical protein
MLAKARLDFTRMVELSLDVQVVVELNLMLQGKMQLLNLL